MAAQNYLSSYWNLYFPSISCDLPSLFTPVGKFAFLLLLPVVCLAAVGLFFAVMWIIDKLRPNERRMENVHFKCCQLAFFCLNFSYFPIVKQTLSILRPCHSDQNVFYMPNSPWIECTSHTYRKLTALGIFSAVFYVTGFPLIVISLMIYFFPKRSSMSPEDRKRLDVWLGPVYVSYKPKCQSYFEVFMLLRRLILAIALSMISSSSTLQTFVVWLVLMQSAITHLNLQPYEGHSAATARKTRKRSILECTLTENVIEPIVLVVLSMSFMVLRFAAMDNVNTNVFVYVVMIVNTCVLVVLVGAIFYRLICKDEGRGNRSSGSENGGYSDVSAITDFDGSNEERRHLLTVNSQLRYVPIEEAA